MELQTLTQKIRKEFPKLDFKKAKFINDGWDHYVVIIDDKIVFRFPKNKYDQERFSNEVELLRYLEKKLPVNIPNYHYVAKNNIFAGYEIIKGERFSRFIFENRLNDQDREKFAREMAGFLTALHKILLRSIEKFKVEPINHQEMYRKLERRCQKYLYPCLSKRENERIRECLRKLEKYAAVAKNEVLSHTDINWDNILINKNRLAGIIDFSDYAISERANDFGELWYYGEKFVNRVYELYQDKKNDNLLERSYLYYQQSGLWVLSGTIKGSPMSYKRAYEEFRERMEL